MKSYQLLFMSALLFVVNLLVSQRLADTIETQYSERFVVLNKVVLIPFPRDTHYGMSNMSFINTMSYIGYVLEKNRGRILPEEGLKIYQSLDSITLYNPRYFDPYYVANAFLTWETGLYTESIKLLKRGLNFIDDWRIPFYIGFTYFYFLQDNAKGAKYLEIASKYRNATEYNLLPLLASRLYYEEGRVELAIAILKDQLRIMREEAMKEALESRIKTLENVLLIKRAMSIYMSRYGKRPKSIDELVKAGLLPPDMKDSSGGKFYITQEGKVRSEKVLRPIRRKLLEKGVR